MFLQKDTIESDDAIHFLKWTCAIILQFTGSGKKHRIIGRSGKAFASAEVFPSLLQEPQSRMNPSNLIFFIGITIFSNIERNSCAKKCVQNYNLFINQADHVCQLIGLKYFDPGQEVSRLEDSGDKLFGKRVC